MLFLYLHETDTFLTSFEIYNSGSSWQWKVYL